MPIPPPRTVTPHRERPGIALPSGRRPLFIASKKGILWKKLPRKHSTSVGILLSLNHMKLSDPLYVNRILKISGASREKGESGAEGAGLGGEKRACGKNRKGDLPGQKGRHACRDCQKAWHDGRCPRQIESPEAVRPPFCR